MIHTLDPIALSVFGWPIRWYGILYAVSLVCCIFYAERLSRRGLLLKMTPSVFDGLALWCIVGAVVGGRVGYALLYSPWEYLANPFQLIRVWEGGMSFHGGLAGIIGTLIFFARRHQVSLLGVSDMVSTVAPIGLGLGRLGNFINGEHFGYVTTLPWGVIFPGGGPISRHPSQLYEAALEGAFLFLLLSYATLYKKWGALYPGRLTALFLIGYAVARWVGECFRVPDGWVGPITYGQALCIPMVFLGIGVWYFSEKKST